MSVLDDIFEKAKDVTSAATKKTDAIVKISKIKLNCVQINNAIKTEFEHLGASLYDQMKSNEEDMNELMAIVEVIDGHYQELNELNHKLEELQNILVCPACGAKNKPGSAYCSRCGTKLAEEEPDVMDEEDGDTGFDPVQ